MSDPLEPFRAEFARLNRPNKSYKAVIHNYEAWKPHARHQLVNPALQEQRYRAAKVLQIAETQGPNAALLWKLSN